MIRRAALDIADCRPAVDYIADCVRERRLKQLTQAVSITFFDGYYLSPKPLKAICSVREWRARSGGGEVVFDKKFSVQSAAGYIEGIPLLGTPLACIGVVAHFFLGMREMARLKRCTKEWEAVREAQDNTRAAAAARVYNAAIGSVAQGHMMWSSALAIIPLVKPLYRGYQAIYYREHRGHSCRRLVPVCHPNS